MPTPRRLGSSTRPPFLPSERARGHAAAEERGIRFLDAPVFGSKTEAQTGGLWVVVGGRRDDYEAAMPVLEPISETTHYMGPATSGCMMKLVGTPRGRPDVAG